MAAASDAAAEAVLAARALSSAVNSAELLQSHREATGGVVHTRFPPEPNGYLHVGHAKSLHMNFKLAFDKLGVAPDKRATILRYDDTNPEKESLEFIENIAEDVRWMGWSPVRVTHTSDYFDVLYELALKLIREGKAYVCHQTKDEIEASRAICKARLEKPESELAQGNPNSPFRDRPVEENLREFENMRKGKYDVGAATLRLKMDMTSANYNMWDQVAYRIKYVGHPHVGDKWCVYPTYDYTHCIIDSLEHIDYSICTLEFETRRESYYWVLEALGIYRPSVYEFSRLNLSYTVLSKRKLLKLVNCGYVSGWDDPRMPTIRGMRRRGYTREALCAFCEDVGVTRNDNVIQYERLQHAVRGDLHERAPRVMGVLDPLRVEVANLNEPRALNAPDFPFDPERGAHALPLTAVIFVDRSDFRDEDDPDFFGMAPGKLFNLKYAGTMRVDDVVRGADGTVELVRVSTVEATDTKVRGGITWVPEGSMPCEVRLYEHLFTVEAPTSEWESQLNPTSLVVKPNALVDPSFAKWGAEPMTFVQFERLGFFVTDTESTPDRVVFNRIVTLRESAVKANAAGTNVRSRKAEQEAQAAENERLKALGPMHMFRTEEYSEWDDTGLPTKMADGTPVSKGARKKLEKKRAKLFPPS